MNYTPFFIAWRYIRGAQRKRTVSTVMSIVFLSMLIGSAALTLTIAIMQGFEQATYERLQSIHAEVMIRGFGQPLDIDALEEVIVHEFPEIAYTTPHALHQVIIQNPDTDEITHIVSFKAIDPLTAPLVTTLQQKVLAAPSDKTSLAELVRGQTIIIGKKLAESLGISIGDTNNLLFAPNLLAKNSSLRKKTKLMQQRATIAGFFITGIEDFDMGMIIGSLDFFNQMFPHVGSTELHVKLSPHADVDRIIHRLRSRLGLEVFSWKELYLPLVAALKLEKYAMILILVLITIIASMNIISLLLILITQKRTDIAIFQTCGMSINTIRTIFMIIGMGISCTAACLGITIAGLIAWCIQAYPCIHLPDAYIVTHLPVEFTFSMALAVFVFVACTSFIAVLIPLSRLQEYEIADLLRFTS